MSKMINSLCLYDYTVIDTEYLCFDPKHPIYQVGILKIRSSKPDKEYSFIFNPHQSKSPKDMELNDLTDEQLRSAPDISEKIEEIVDLIGNDIILGYNVFNADISKLSYELYHKTGKEILNDYVDVMELVKDSNLPLGINEQFVKKTVSLQDVCDYLGLKERHHDALSDCITAYKVYEIIKFIPQYDMSEHMTKAISSTKPKNDFYKKKREGRYSYFESVSYDGNVYPSIMKDLKIAFSDCAPDYESLVIAMKSLGMTSDNLYEKVVKKDGLNYVVIPDKDNPTIKGKNAIKYGITLISFDEFEKMIDEEMKKVKSM